MSDRSLQGNSKDILVIIFFKGPGQIKNTVKESAENGGLARKRQLLEENIIEK